MKQATTIMGVIIIILLAITVIFWALIPSSSNFTPKDNSNVTNTSNTAFNIEPDSGHNIKNPSEDGELPIDDIPENNNSSSSSYSSYTDTNINDALSNLKDIPAVDPYFADYITYVDEKYHFFIKFPDDWYAFKTKAITPKMTNQIIFTDSEYLSASNYKNSIALETSIVYYLEVWEVTDVSEIERENYQLLAERNGLFYILVIPSNADLTNVQKMMESFVFRERE